MMEALFDAWHPSWKTLPWKSFTSPYERFQELPSFVVGEFFFITFSFLLLVHALKNGRNHVVLWLASLLTGTANDAFFMALPIVDNFWQSQACIMLTPRMPLYIPCVYIVFMYPSLIGAWKFKMPALAQAGLSGLMGEMIYAPYDITGIKLLWWTWHDTDAPIKARILGAPVGSTAWVITFCSSFHFIWRKLMSDKQVSGEEKMPLGKCLFNLTISAALTTPLMMAQMAFFQLISGDLQGLPTLRTLLAVIGVYCLLIFFLKANPKDKKNVLGVNDSLSSLLKNLITLYFIYIFVNMVVAVPENHKSTGIHQTVGPCNIYAKDISGHDRQLYLCQDTHSQDWNFDCKGFDLKGEKRPLDFDTEWYTVCGNPHSNKGLFLLVIFGLAVMGTFTYRTAFGASDNKKKFQ